MAYEPTPWDSYTTAGLTGAQGLMGTPTATYPEYVSSAARAPVSTDYFGYTPTAPMASITAPDYRAKTDTPTWQGTSLGMQTVSSPTATTAGYNWSALTPAQQAAYQSVNTTANAAGYNWQDYGQAAPTYQGLMSGDYNALQQALTTPGAIAANTAYNQGYSNLTNTMGGQGLYGSSIMQNQATNNLDSVYQNALATNAANAATQRYGLQQTDLTNASAQQMAAWQALLGENTAQNTANLDYSKLLTQNNQQNTQNALSQAQALNSLKSSDYQALNNILSQQNLAKNTNALDYSKLSTNTNLQNAANQLSASQANQGAYAQLQSLLSQQGLAQNAQGLDVYKQLMSQQSDLNKYNAQNYATSIDQNKALYLANAQEASNQNAYNASNLNWNNTNLSNYNTWQNAQDYEKYTYELAKAAYENQGKESAINQYLALAGQGSPLTASALNYSTAQQQMAAAQQAAQQAASAQNTASWLGAAGSLTGGLLSGDNLSTIGSWFT